MDKVFINRYPLVQHEVTRLHDRTTDTNEFRSLVGEISILMNYGAPVDLTTEDIEVETPLEHTLSPIITGRKMTVVSILRAGLGVVNGIQALVPTAKVGHIGLCHDPDTHEPIEYYYRLPAPIKERTIAVADPILATDGSACSAIRMIEQHGSKKIRFICIIAAPERLERLRKEHSDIQIYMGRLNCQLNEHVCILPDLDGAGDRISGTK